MLVTSIFPFSHNVFYRIKDRNHNFSNIRFVVGKCFEFCPVQNFVVWLRIKTMYNFVNMPFVAEPVWLDQYRTGPESRRTLVRSQSRPISFRSLMINIVTEIFLTAIFSTVIIWESSHWLRKNILGNNM